MYVKPDEVIHFTQTEDSRQGIQPEIIGTPEHRLRALKAQRGQTWWCEESVKHEFQEVGQDILLLQEAATC